MTLAPERPVDMARTAAPAPVPSKASGEAARLDLKAGLPTVLVLITFLTVWVVVYVVYLSRIEEARIQRELYGDLRSEFALQTAPVGGAIRVGAPVAVIDAPAAGLHDAVLVEGTSSQALAKGPGHLRTTPLPGQVGTSVLFGRSVSFGGPFAHIPRLKPRDLITTTTQQGTFTYRVDRVRRKGDPAAPAPAAGSSHLLLVSAEGSGFLGSLSPSHEVYVDATLQGKPASGPSAGAGVAGLASNEKVLAVDKEDLPALVLSLQLLLLSTAAVVWGAMRWDRRKAYILGVPVLIAVLWTVSHQTFVLLPNLI